MSQRKTVSASVDSIEGNVAVLVDSNDQVTMPVSWLPSGVREGSAVELTIKLDAQAEGDAADRIRNLQGRLKRR